MRQYDRILCYLDTNGSITSMDAFIHLGITKLTTRISELRGMGFVFLKQTESGVNRFGDRVSFARYRLIKRGELRKGRKDEEDPIQG